MSLGLTMPLAEADRITKALADDLRTHVERLQVVGSVRRRKPRVSDIEILVEPRMVVADLFNNLEPDIEGLRAKLETIGRIVKGGDRYIQIGDLYGGEARLDLFIASPPASWGALLAIRTGPVDLSKLLVTRMRRFGYQTTDGHAISIDTGEVIATDTEEAFFELAGLPCLPPPQRDDVAATVPA